MISFQFLLLFKLVVIFVTFHLMLKGLEVIFKKYFLIIEGEGVWLDVFKIIYIIEGARGGGG